MGCRLYITCLLAAMTGVVTAQTNRDHQAASPGGISNSQPVEVRNQVEQARSVIARAEKIRAVCIENRRIICGRILNVLPDGLVVESGYTNLMRQPLTRSWLVPATVSAKRTANLVESNEPGAICVGRVFIANLPSSKRLKPKRYDYVIIEGYPAGEHTYTSLGTINRTVRNFSASLDKAVALILQVETKPPSTTAAR